MQIITSIFVGKEQIKRNSLIEINITHNQLNYNISLKNLITRFNGLCFCKVGKTFSYGMMMIII